MIIYFTGCGNSGDVALRLAGALGDDCLVRLAAENIHSGRIDAADSADTAPQRRIVWVMPVYSWGVPPVVVKFIHRAQIEGAHTAAHHLVLTCGDDAGLADRQWRRLMRQRGWRACSASTVIMPNTYTLMKGFDTDPAALEKEKLDASVARVKAIAEEISLDRVSTDITRGRWAWIKSRIIYPWFKRFAMSPKPLHHTDACIGCGACSRACPMANIEMHPIFDVDLAAGQSPDIISGPARPHWGKDCALCLGCYNICPVHAVAYGRATTSKHQYYNPAFRAKTASRDNQQGKI